MYELDDKYLAQLEELAAEIQESEVLQQYLEEEEEEHFNQLKDLFEPRIQEVYEQVAADWPLQLIHLELVLLDENFEGLFTPKILGYSVLRGQIDDTYTYLLPQEHFKTILLAICESPNFEILRHRIGQTVQVGFALSSDIWVTNLINSIENKRIRHFLQSLKKEELREVSEREKLYKRYAHQFRNDNFMSATYPEQAADLALGFPPLKRFLLYRISNEMNNSSLLEPTRAMLRNDAFAHTPQLLQTLVLHAAFLEEEDKERKKLQKNWIELRDNLPEFEEQFFQFLLELHHREDIRLDPEADLRLARIVDRKAKDEAAQYFDLLEEVHAKGIEDVAAQEAIKAFSSQREGLSLVNEALRKTIYKYFERYIRALDVEDYAPFYEIVRLYPVYMQIFANEHFNQELKNLSMSYVRKLLKRYTDKRGKDYQDIKKFVSATFQDLNFLTEKETVELFKTRRKKKKTTS